MKKRIIVGVSLFFIAVVIFTFRLYVTPYVLDALILAISVLGTLEISKMLKKANKPSSLIISLAYSVLTYVIILISVLHKESIFITLLVALAALVILSLLAFIVEACNIGKENFKKLGLNTLLNCFYPTTLFMPIYLINHLVDYSAKIAGQDLVSFFLALLIFLVAICTDTFAFFVGRTLKGPKLAPKISPNKTISGAIGGLCGGVVAGVVLYIIFNYILNLSSVFSACSINFISVPILSIVLSIFSQAGDLFASFLKRKHTLKDYSNIFGEQGGIMDRFDGESFVAPITLIFVLIFVI